ncbi:MAG: hypothetical protein VX641_03980 [Planctomycetota bacterium]|nr:hypothetical protein [Planctomycetota bacterium]
MRTRTRHAPRPYAMRLALIAGLIGMTSGCVSEFKANGESRLVLPEDEQIETIHRVDDGDGTSMTAMRSLSTVFRMQRKGSIAFNGINLPLFESAEGTHVATQEGSVAGNLTTAESVRGAERLKVIIHRLGERGGPRQTFESESGILLGRNGNQRGFLVERPNEDGSRSIGLASWTDGTVDWLLDDGRVNAFGWIDTAGRIAYSTRSPDDSSFVVGIREADGTRWTIEEDLPYSWMFPILDPDGQTLFSVRLGDGYADMVHGTITNNRAFRETMKAQRMSNRASARRVSQMVSTSTSGVYGDEYCIPWYSYELERMVVWDVGELTVELLAENSVAAFPLKAKHNWLVTTPDGLDRTALFVSKRSQDRLLDFPWLARARDGDQVVIIEPLDQRIEIAILEFGSRE